MSTAHGQPKGFRRIGTDRYRALELRIWRLIQRLDGDAVKLFVYLWFGPHSQPHGILHFPREYALIDLHWTPEQLARAWGTLEAADLLWSDGELAVVVPFLQSNPPANPDVVTHWRKAIAALPESPLFERLYRRALAWVSEEGLSWLVSKITTVSPTMYTPSSDGADTGPTPSTQYAVLRTQASELKLQVQEEGGNGGKEPDAALRSASPSETASLRAAVSEADLFGARPEALERANKGQRLARLAELFVGFGTDRSGACAFARKAGYTDHEIEAVSPVLPPGNGRCQGVSHAGECGLRLVPGTSYCRFHQAQASPDACPI